VIPVFPTSGSQIPNPSSHDVVIFQDEVNLNLAKFRSMSMAEVQQAGVVAPGYSRMRHMRDSSIWGTGDDVFLVGMS
jgi:hypothetical protein